jgi:hypothetical protein
MAVAWAALLAQSVTLGQARATLVTTVSNPDAIAARREVSTALRCVHVLHEHPPPPSWKVAPDSVLGVLDHQRQSEVKALWANPGFRARGRRRPGMGAPSLALEERIAPAHPLLGLQDV